MTLVSGCGAGLVSDASVVTELPGIAELAGMAVERLVSLADESALIVLATARLATSGSSVRTRPPEDAPPFRPLTAEEEATVVAEIDRSEADVVWVGTGQPKQELWMARMRDRLAAPVLVGVGAAFDFHAGLVPQAPNWMQDRGLEWTYRFYQEPRRLWRRYLRYNPRFLAGFARQYARHRRGR